MNGASKLLNVSTLFHLAVRKKICSCARHTVGTATELNIRYTEILISSTYLPKFFTNF